MTTTYTETFRFEKPDFRSPDWASSMQRNFDALDMALRNILMDVVPWENDTEYEVGHVVIDTVAIPVGYWINSVTHTTASAPGTFAQERVANPTYWTAFSFGIQARGAWTNNTAYNVNDIAYDSVRGITGIVHTAHLSNAAGTILDDSANWNFIVNLPTVFTAVATTYDPVASGLSATNVQDAVDEIKALVAGAYVSNNVAYDPTASSMVATNVKAAIDELKALNVTNANAIAANTVAITTGLISTGFPHWRPTNEVLAGWVVANGLTIGNAGSAATSRANADTAALYTWHWNNFSNTECPVSTGRGLNAAADFAALKTITVLDMKGTGSVGVDTMGASATTRLAGVPVTSGSLTAAGSIIGENTHANTLGELPTGITSANAAQSISVTVATPSSRQIATAPVGDTATWASVGGGGGPIVPATSLSGQWSGLTSISGTTNNAIGVTSNNTSGTAHNTVGRSRTGYWYLKL